MNEVHIVCKETETKTSLSIKIQNKTSIYIYIRCVTVPKIFIMGLSVQNSVVLTTAHAELLCSVCLTDLNERVPRICVK